MISPAYCMPSSVVSVAAKPIYPSTLSSSSDTESSCSSQLGSQYTWDGQGNGFEIHLELLLQFVASGKKCAPDGYKIDADGLLVIDTAADMFEVPVSTAEPDLSGRGKRRHFANKQYDAFEQH